MKPLAIAPGVAAADATFAVLAERMRSRGDMPAFARSIGAILGALRGEEDSGFDMTRTVLADPALTQKVLRLANSGMYAAFGQRISTVSRAVMVLGTDAIGHLALGLKVVDEAGGAGGAQAEAQAEMEQAVLAGIVARQLDDGEEAVVGAMLHSLGRMLVAFYLPERWSEIVTHGDDRAAASAVLGISMEELGRAMARQWGLPPLLVDAMRSCAPGLDGAAAAGPQRLGAMSTLAAGAARLLWHGDPAGAARLAASYAGALGLPAARLTAAVSAARQAAPAAMTLAPDAHGARALPTLRADGVRLLVSGVADMHAAADAARPAEMLSMALETLYQGLGFTRAVAFLRQPRAGRYTATMGFGPGMEQLLPALTLDDKFAPDVFHAALAGDRVVFVRQAREAQFAARLPRWWHASLSQARSFVILPLCRGGRALGFLYGDWLSDLPPPQLDQAHFAALNELRGMVVESVERRHAAA